MRILALETTDKTGSVAAIHDSKPLLQRALGDGQRSAQSLAPAIEALLRQVDWRPQEVQLVAVSIGPGSFTGLRVGVTMAKVFAYAIGADTLAVNTLQAVATAAPDDVPQVTAIMDAQRGDIVTQTFVRQPTGDFEPASPQALVAADAWIAALTPASVVTGPGLVKLVNRLPDHVRILDQNLWAPTAMAVARIADRYYRQGRRDDLWKLVPLYSRRSAAEEKWDAQQNTGLRTA